MKKNLILISQIIGILLMFIILQNIIPYLGAILLAMFYKFPLSQISTYRFIQVENHQYSFLVLYIFEILGEILPIIILYYIFRLNKKVIIMKNSLKKKLSAYSIGYVIILSIGFSIFNFVIINTILLGVSITYKLSPITSEQILKLLPEMLTAGIIAPVIEEFLFRGVIFEILRNKFKAKISIIIQALIFGIMHAFDGGPTSLYIILHVISTFIFGLIFANLLIETKSFYSNILSHILNNIMAICIFPLIVPRYYNTYVYLIISIILLLISFAMHKKFKIKNKDF